MTEQEIQELKNDIIKDVVNELKAGSTSELELEEVQTLDNIFSLPASRGNEMVKVPVKLLEAYVKIVNNLTDGGSDLALSAEQGKVLNQNKQNKLTAGSGMEIKNNVISATIKIIDNLIDDSSDSALSANQGRVLYSHARNHDTVSFGGIVEGDIPVQGISFSGEIQEGKIYYSTKLKSFYYRKTESSGITPAQYTNNWDGRENYCEEISGEPYKGKVYVAGGSTYVWNGSELVKPAGSGSAVTPVTIVDNLSEGGSDAALSAEQGKTLNENAVHHDTVSFKAVVKDNVQIEMVSITETGEPVWSETHKTFLLQLGRFYYNNWRGRERFCEDSGGVPYREKVYVCNGSTYVWNGENLVSAQIPSENYELPDKAVTEAKLDDFLAGKTAYIIETLEDGFFLVDENMNIGGIMTPAKDNLTKQEMSPSLGYTILSN